MTRLLTAAFLVPATWYLCKRAPFPVFLAAAFLVAAVTSWEAYRLLAARGSRPIRLLGIGFGLIVVWAFSALPPHVDPAAVLAAAALAIPVAAMALREDPPAMIDAMASTMGPVVFVTFTLAHCVGLRAVPGEDGSDLLLLLLVCVTLSYTGAYYVGSAFGRHKLAPVLSPKKTWEGAAGGLFGSALGASIAHLWFYRRLPIPHAAAIAVLVWGADVLGDLVESAWKRAAGVKDSSGLLPGHGGLLDRVDGLMFAGPVLYYYWRAFLAG